MTNEQADGHRPRDARYDGSNVGLDVAVVETALEHPEVVLVLPVAVLFFTPLWISALGVTLIALGYLKWGTIGEAMGFGVLAIFVWFLALSSLIFRVWKRSRGSSQPSSPAGRGGAS